MSKVEVPPASCALDTRRRGNHYRGYGRLRRLHRGALAQHNSMRRIVIAIGLGTLATVVIAFVVTEWFEVAIKRVVIGVIMFLGTLR